MKTKVYMSKQGLEETDQELVIRTLQMASLKDIINNKEKKILINPNWVCDDHSNTGNVTSTDTIEGIIQYLIDESNISPEKITVADGGQTSSTQRTIKLNDVYRLEEYGITIADLNQDKRISDIKINNPLALKSINIAKTVMDVSCIISVPSLKTHSMAGTTLSMKNMMGAILPKGVMHSNIHKKIADLTSLFRSKMKFQVIDGIIGSDGFEIGGSPVEMDLIIAGEDPVAVDTVGSAVIGYTPKYLKFAEKKGLGIANLENIEIIGSKIEEVFKRFY
ncbi:MAG: DUF362 domain-containing protein [Promethearchaeota archaeon]